METGIRKDKFKVGFTILNLIIGVVVAGLIAGLGIYEMVKHGLIAAGIILIITAIIIAVVVIGGMSFKLVVDGERFTVSGGFAKKCEFSAAEIVHVHAEKSGNAKSGHNRTITIKTEKRDVTVTHLMKGFDDICVYLIYHHQAGDIRTKAIKEKDMKLLKAFHEDKNFK